MKLMHHLLSRLLILLLALITVDVLWGVFTRYALGHQAGWTEELARFLLIWIGLLGAAYASGGRLHLSIDLLEHRLERRSRRRLRVFIAGCVLVFALAVLVVGGGRLVYLTHILGQRSPALNLPMAGVYLALPLSGLLIAAYQLHHLRRPGAEAL